MIEFAIAIVILAALITFWSTFKRSGEVLSGTIELGINAIDTVNEVADDSLKTYSVDVSILNAKKRQEQDKEIAEMAKDGTHIPSTADLKAKLAGLKS